MDVRRDEAVMIAMESVAPGSPLRDGVDRVLQASRGALIVLGDPPEVLSICSGGFLLDASFTPQRLAELAKMDGAIILAGDLQRIARANVHLVPNPNVPTSETGTRHRTAERVARSLAVPVIAVSESRKEIQIYIAGSVYQLKSTSQVLERSSQAIRTLERYRERLDIGAQNLSALELADRVRIVDVIELLQATEVVVRMSQEMERNLIELGSDGRLVRLQLEELMAGVDDDRRLLLRDYLPEDAKYGVSQAMDALAGLSDEMLFDDEKVARALHLINPAMDETNQRVEARGYRYLSKIKGLSLTMVYNLVDHYGLLSKMLQASAAELAQVEGVAEKAALSVANSRSHVGGAG